ncbi:putative CFEM domain protein [Aspergillus nomiae NRRL 13137]|uniref:Putative CFEM domain protein n=1 Tax=Aspergillus nomiae NRRL (strain ATCC 15546 / NRRL 13137 / CBS 260.88 / M93) TaxID=1509407 RepID=A0A0L1J699_ASPN3|nr:putative CFEM domain protein [Aspergillus nomiae NRRL 13137]KNG87267.1 putative CFEM domain protein [Aspergillus nomiae NRRL 13137]
MKLYYISVILTTCLSTVFAQGMDGLPDCAKDCATGSIPKQCQTIDVACICGDKSFINSISCCVANKCSKDQQDAVLKFAGQLCSGAGVNNLPTSASCAEGSSSATETSSDSSASSKPTTSGSSDSSASPTASKSDSNTKTSSTSTTSPTASTGGAGLVQSKDTSLLAAIGAAVFAFLA